jgi:putative ABC transport system permease protein
MFLNSLRLAWREVSNNLLRSGLTILGVIIGVAAVIATVSIGSGATDKITGEISGLGRNLIIVVPGSQSRTGGPLLPAPPFETDDVEAIRKEIATVSAAVGVATQGVQVVFGNENRRTTVNGADNAFLEVRDWQVAHGRAFTDAELRAGKAVCVLGHTVRKELFGLQDPLGATVRLERIPCEVIGVMEEKGQTTFGSDQDDFVLAPLALVQRRIAGNRDVDLVYVSARADELLDKTHDSITALMRERRKIRADEEEDFIVRDVKEITEIVGTVTNVMTAFLGAVAAISLLVGGIGIMNIMLVSVTERTREIGIRLAIGARAQDVLLQFLIEAVVLSALGGLIGIALGLGLAFAGTTALGLPFAFEPGIVLIAFSFSLVVGMVFGFFPARRAARLDPIEALRYE